MAERWMLNKLEVTLYFALFVQRNGRRVELG